MPIHDWTRIDVGTYHDFHQDWTMQIRRALNAGVLPPGYVAQADQRVLGYEPDVIALHQRPPASAGGGLAVADTPPRVRQSARIETDRAAYARKANRIAVKHKRGRVVAVIEVVSPGNKDSKHAIRSFTRKLAALLRAGVNALVVDLFPPTPRDPDGIHRVIWDDLAGEPFEPRPDGKPLTVAGYDARGEDGDGLTAWVDPVAVGDPLPDGPLFLGPGWYVNCPLEASYRASWDALPASTRELVEPPASAPPAVE